MSALVRRDGRLLEVCCGGLECARAALAGGCDRIELCAALSEGGVTPSIGLVEAVVQAAREHGQGVKVFVLVRPRSGDFCYGPSELSIIHRDILAAAGAGADGVVVGALTPGGLIDMDAMRGILSVVESATRKLEVTFSRAIDMARDQVESTQKCVELGIDRILTSGGAASAVEGSTTIRQMVEAAGGRVIVMAGGGIGPENVAALVESTGVPEVHGSLRSKKRSPSTYRKSGVSMGARTGDTDEYARLVCDAQKVAAVGRALEQQIGKTSETQRPKPRVVIVPGNGCTNTEKANWYAWARERLRTTKLFEEVVLPRAMPDPYRASEAIWLKYLREECHVDDGNTIVIGHSSGAVAAMRLLENTPLIGAVLVAACWTDLGEESERISGYYSRPWLWERIKANAGWIIQFHSCDDPFIPVAESRHVAKHLCSEYNEYSAHSHFFEPFEELIEEILKKVTK
eukprot:g2336.t1